MRLRFVATSLCLLAAASCRSRPASPSAPAPPTAPEVIPSTRDASTAATARTPVDAGSPSAPDAGPPLIDLLHASRAEVSVSSVVANNTDRPQNLVDDSFDTAWSSRTDDLSGAEIDFRVPDDAEVDSIAMTVGMTRTADAGDLFAMNYRIASVAVYRGYDSLGRFPLDVNDRGLQHIPVHAGGGVFRIVFLRLEPGTQRNWREASVSQLEVLGRIANPTPNVPVVRVGHLLPTTLPGPYMIPATSHIESGCFAWSPRDHVAACVRGSWGLYGGEGNAWTAAFVGSENDTVVDLVAHVDGGLDERPSEAALTPTVLRAVRTELAHGSYVALAPLAIDMAAGIPVERGDGVATRWMRRRTFRGGDNAAERFTDRLQIRYGARDGWTDVQVYENEPVFEPTMRTYFVPGTSFVILDAVRRHGDEGLSADVSDGWRCDATARSCE